MVIQLLYCMVTQKTAAYTGAAIVRAEEIASIRPLRVVESFGLFMFVRDEYSQPGGDAWQDSTLSRDSNLLLSHIYITSPPALRERVGHPSVT